MRRCLLTFGIIVVIVQGGLIGRWSHRFGDRRLISMGLLVLGLGLLMIATTMRIPVPWYSQEAVASELSTGRTLPGETPVAPRQTRHHG